MRFGDFERTADKVEQEIKTISEMEKMLQDDFDNYSHDIFDTMCSYQWSLRFERTDMLTKAIIRLWDILEESKHNVCLSFDSKELAFVSEILKIRSNGGTYEKNFKKYEDVKAYNQKVQDDFFKKFEEDLSKVTESKSIEEGVDKVEGSRLYKCAIKGLGELSDYINNPEGKEFPKTEPIEEVMKMMAEEVPPTPEETAKKFKEFCEERNKNNESKESKGE